MLAQILATLDASGMHARGSSCLTSSLGRADKPDKGPAWGLQHLGLPDPPSCCQGPRPVAAQGTYRCQQSLPGAGPFSQAPYSQIVGCRGAGVEIDSEGGELSGLSES